MYINMYILLRRMSMGRFLCGMEWYIFRVQYDKLNIWYYYECFNWGMQKLFQMYNLQNFYFYKKNL